MPSCRKKKLHLKHMPVIRSLQGKELRLLSPITLIFTFRKEKIVGERRIKSLRKWQYKSVNRIKETNEINRAQRS